MGREIAREAPGPPRVEAGVRPFGLAEWMHRVVVECDRAAAGFDAEAVHDLRVAIRRCRSMAGALEQIDPDGDWRRMRKLGLRLFRSLGELRDVQVMREWIERLAPPGDPLRPGLDDLLAGREALLKTSAAAAIEEFPRAQWNRLARRLPARIRRLRPDGGAFESLALERWTEAFDRHRAALRRRSGIGWHLLRIAVKRFRYVVENFLPRRHADWGGELKRAQDLLGEVHDLDVLAVEVRRMRTGWPPETIGAWRERIAAERRARLREYRARTTGRDSLWGRWRAGLPEGGRVLATSRQRLTAWASTLDPEFRRARRVTRLALALHAGLSAAGVEWDESGVDSLRLLETAGLLHGVGRADGAGGYHKSSRRRIGSLNPPPGWTAEEIEWVSLIARYHRGAEPKGSHGGFARLDASRRRLVVRLAGVLRLAAALCERAGGGGGRVSVEPLGDVLQVWVPALDETPAAAARLAAAKHLLEGSTGRTLLLRPRPPRP